MKQGLVLLMASWAPLLWATNFADQVLDQLAEQARAINVSSQPVDTLLLADRIYMRSHWSGQQDRIGELLWDLYRRADHQELRAELGYIVTQHEHHRGNLDAIGQLTKELGYVPEWSVLGPLKPGAVTDPADWVDRDSVDGLDRPVSPTVIRAYGESDFWGEGIGQVGFFAANNALFPSQLAGGLYSTWFRAEDKGIYRFALGWHHQARVWVNDTEILNAMSDQKPHPDQGVVQMKLRKGWYRLTVLIETPAERANLGFFARLTDAEGQAVQWDARADTGVPRRNPKIVEPPQDSLLAMAQSVGTAALGQTLMLKEQALDSTYGNPNDLLAQAFADKPSMALAESLLSLTRNPNVEWQHLTTLLDNLPNEAGLERAWALTQKGQIALDQSRYWEARHFAERALTAHANYWPARILDNNTLNSLGLAGEALFQTEALAKKYSGVPWIMMDLADLYWSMDFSRESETYVNRVLALRASNDKYAERKIDILKGRGDLEALDAFFQQLIRISPYVIPLHLNYANFLSANQRYERAEAALQHVLDQVPENPMALQAMGELKLTTGQDDALVYLERALTLQPQNPALEKLIELSKAEQQAFYQPYRYEAVPEVEVLEVSPIVINLDNTVKKVASNGQASTYHQLEYEVIDAEEANQELPGYSFSYSPLRERVRVIKAEIHRGEETILLTRFGRSRISDPAYRMYYDLVAYQIPFPSLENGDRIVIEYRIDDVGTNNIFGDYFGDLHYFANRYPAKRIAYTLMVPEGRQVHYHLEKLTITPDIETVAGNRIYRWVRDQSSPYETESRMPGLESYLPYVGVSTFNDWQHMARWYHQLIEDQLVLDLETKKIVAELTDGMTDRLEIVKKVHEYVVTNTRYVALEFGIHGYKPYKVNQVCSRQFGDCKDKASLIIAMLREAGVPAHIAIVRTSDKGEIHPFPAMLNYFNHAIAYVPEFDLWLDGTAEFSGIDELPAMDQGALTLVVDEQGQGRLTKIPVYDNSKQVMRYDLDLDDTGQAQVQGELHYQGVDTPPLRQYLAIESKLRQNVGDLVSNRVPGIDIQNADREGTGLNDPITLRFSGQTRQLAQSGNDRIKLPMTILADGLAQRWAPNARRRFPLELGVPKTKEVTLNIASPPGMTVVDLPEPLEEENEHLKVAIQFNRDGDKGVRVDYTVIFKSSQVEPEAYPSLREIMQAHDRVLDQTIEFARQ